MVCRWKSEKRGRGKETYGFPSSTRSGWDCNGSSSFILLDHKGTKWPQKSASARVSLGEATQRGTRGIGMSFPSVSGLRSRIEKNIDASAARTDGFVAKVRENGRIETERNRCRNAGPNSSSLWILSFSLLLVFILHNENAKLKCQLFAPREREEGKSGLTGHVLYVKTSMHSKCLLLARNEDRERASD